MQHELKTVRALLSLALLTTGAAIAQEIDLRALELEHGVTLGAVGDGEESVARESGAPRPEPEAYGTLDQIVYYVTGEEFTPLNSSTTWSLDSGMFRFVSGGNNILRANVHLPAGARITSVELTGCDDNAGQDISVILFRNQDPAASAGAVASFSTGGTPGCDFFHTEEISFPTVNNLDYKYTLTVQLGNDSTLRFRGVRVFYRLRLSPAPGTASFGDVPTSHPFFQHVEALAASGITSGCGGGDFCPNAPLTRGQMAVFLAKALGLHWPF